MAFISICPGACCWYSRLYPRRWMIPVFKTGLAYSCAAALTCAQTSASKAGGISLVCLSVRSMLPLNSPDDLGHVSGIEVWTPAPGEGRTQQALVAVYQLPHHAQIFRVIGYHEEIHRPHQPRFLRKCGCRLDRVVRPGQCKSHQKNGKTADS
jgi:hypothetical protein